MIDGFISAQRLLYWVLYLVIFALCLWALVDCALRSSRAFPAAGKRTHGFWLAITAAATVVAFLALPFAVVPFMQFLAIVGVVGAIVYLVDVRPAVARYSRRRGGGPGSGGSRGGW